MNIPHTTMQNQHTPVAAQCDTPAHITHNGETLISGDSFSITMLFHRLTRPENVPPQDAQAHASYVSYIREFFGWYDLDLSEIRLETGAHETL